MQQELQIDSVLSMQKEKSKMFKAIKDEKIIAISDTDSEFKLLVCDAIASDPDHTCLDYEHYQGEFLLKSDIPAPTKEEVSETRKQLYTEQADPLTAQISRLKDEEQTEELIAEIEALKVERSEIVAKIKEENPYPEEPTEPTETATSDDIHDSESTGLSWKNE